MPIKKNVTTVYVCDCCGVEHYAYDKYDGRIVCADLTIELPAAIIEDGGLVVCARCMKAVVSARMNGITEGIVALWEKYKEE